MKNIPLKTLFGLALPLVLATACANHERRAETSYDSAQFTALTPTSDRGDGRSYADAPAGTYAPPQGAQAADWTLGEEIRSVLTSDPKLARAPMQAYIKGSEVTLRGNVPTQKARERLVDAISKVRGVTRVNDQLEVKNTVPEWRQPSQN